MLLGKHYAYGECDSLGEHAIKLQRDIEERKIYQCCVKVIMSLRENERKVEIKEKDYEMSRIIKERNRMVKDS